MDLDEEFALAADMFEDNPAAERLAAAGNDDQDGGGARAVSFHRDDPRSGPTFAELQFAEGLLHEAEVALAAAVDAIKVGAQMPLEDVDEKVKAVWGAWRNLLALEPSLKNAPKKEVNAAQAVLGEKRDRISRRDTADLQAQAGTDRGTGREGANANRATSGDHGGDDEGDRSAVAAFDGNRSVISKAALDHAQNQIDKYQNGDLNLTTIPGHQELAKHTFLLAAFACNATKPVSELVEGPFSSEWVREETLRIGELLASGDIKSMPDSPLKRFACSTSNITMLTSHFLPSDKGTIDILKDLKPDVNTTEDFMIAHDGKTAETGKMMERCMMQLGHQDHPVLCYNCFNFAEVTVEEYSKLSGSGKYAPPPNAVKIFFDNKLDQQVKDIVYNELLGDLIIFGAPARDVVMKVLQEMEDVVVLEYSAQMAVLAFKEMDATAFRWSNNDTSHPYGKIIVNGKVKNFICVQAPGSNNGFTMPSYGEAGIAENVRTLIRAMDWLKYMHLEGITEDLRQAPLVTACLDFMLQSMGITEGEIKAAAPGTYKTHIDQISAKGNKTVKDAFAAVFRAKVEGAKPASAADRGRVDKIMVGASKGGLANIKNEQVTVAVVTNSDGQVLTTFQGSVVSHPPGTFSIVVGLTRQDNQNARQELRGWIEKANEDLEKEEETSELKADPISTNFPKLLWRFYAATFDDEGKKQPSLQDVDWNGVPQGIKLIGREGMEGVLSFKALPPMQPR